MTSSHVARDFSSGRLHLRITAESAARSALKVDSIWYTVPPDFHTHNDSVAAALMTLVGRRFSDVTFNFSISRYCAELLAWYYGLSTIEPVDESLEPRRPGRFLALNFSGGLDSTALWVLLRELSEITFKVVTSEYQDFVLDRPGYLLYHRDVSSQTNLRKLRYDRHGRFNCATPLLFADYADLWGLVSGHAMNHYPYSFESLADGRLPAFLAQDATLNAGGLAEVHLARGLNEPGLLKLLVEAAPDRIRAALDASAFLGARKRAMKSLMLRSLFESGGHVLPDYLLDTPHPAPGTGHRSRSGVSFRAIWMLKRLGIESVARVEPHVYDTDLSMLDGMSVGFYERYNTSLVGLIPRPLRPLVLRGMHLGGILPYDERDHSDLDITRRYLASVGTEVVSPMLSRLGPPPHSFAPDRIDPRRLEC